jgi:hypothetical protein
MYLSQHGVSITSSPTVRIIRNHDGTIDCGVILLDPLFSIYAETVDEARAMAAAFTQIADQLEQSASGDPDAAKGHGRSRMSEPDEAYKARVERLFQPIRDELDQLRAQLGEPASVPPGSADPEGATFFSRSFPDHLIRFFSRVADLVFSQVSAPLRAE